MLKTIQPSPPTPKRLILSLLSAPDLIEISARQFANWGRLFSIDPAAMRVALGRLVRGDYLESARRGVYRLGPSGRLLAETARSWALAEQRVGPWSGDWLLVHTAHLGRRDKSVLRSRERALRLEGFQALEKELWCRPGNYREALRVTERRLHGLGLDDAAVLLRAGEVVATTDPFQLWPCKVLEARYRALTAAMQSSLLELPALGIDEAAQTTFIIGETVIRQINVDPLLPEELVEVAARRKMHETMVAYDAAGRAAWKRFQSGV